MIETVFSTSGAPQWPEELERVVAAAAPPAVRSGGSGSRVSAFVSDPAHFARA